MNEQMNNGFYCFSIKDWNYFIRQTKMLPSPVLNWIAFTFELWSLCLNPKDIERWSISPWYNLGWILFISKCSGGIMKRQSGHLRIDKPSGCIISQTIRHIFWLLGLVINVRTDSSIYILLCRPPVISKMNFARGLVGERFISNNHGKLEWNQLAQTKMEAIPSLPRSKTKIFIHSLIYFI